MIRTLFIVFLLSAGTATAADWATADTALLGTALGTLAMDWAQTRKVTHESPDVSQTAVHFPLTGSPVTLHAPPRRGAGETNGLLGRYPSNAEINRYFVVSMAATAGLSYVLPPFYRRAFLGGLIAVEASVIVHNDRMGLQIRF